MDIFKKLRKKSAKTESARFDSTLREIENLQGQPEETIENRIKNELHPYLSSLIKKLPEKYALHIKERIKNNAFHPPYYCRLYETKGNDYFIRPDKLKLLKWHSSNGCVYDDAVDVDVETFLKEEIKTPDNVHDLLTQIGKIGMMIWPSYPEKLGEATASAIGKMASEIERAGMCLRCGAKMKRGKLIEPDKWSHTWWGEFRAEAGFDLREYKCPQCGFTRKRFEKPDK